MKTSTFIRRLAAVATVVLAVALETVAAAGTAAAATAPPTISSFTPTSGPVGTLVTIKGTHFGSPAPGLQVLFNGTLAAPETVIANQITVRVPPLATTGPITVKTRYGTAQTRSSFRVTRGIASFPRGAWPGQSITIAGSGFPRFHDMTFKLDGASFGGVATDANGQFSLLRTLPPTITIGPSHILAAIDTITHTQQKIHIWIFGSWLQPRDDAAQSGNGTAESLITPANVAKVHQHYAVGSFDLQVVEDGGRVFAGTLGNSIGAYNPWLLNNSYFDWTAPTDGTVSQAPAVSNSVVYAVTNDRLYALNEYPAGPGGEIRWTAVLGDSANPFPPVVADGRVYVADRGLGELQVFDANGVTNCSGSPTVCTPLWFASYATVFGPPAIDAKSLGGSGDVYLSVTAGGINKIVVRTGAGAVVGSSSALVVDLDLRPVARRQPRICQRLVERIRGRDPLRAGCIHADGCLEQHRSGRHRGTDRRCGGRRSRLRPELGRHSCVHSRVQAAERPFAPPCGRRATTGPVGPRHPPWRMGSYTSPLGPRAIQQAWRR